MEDGQIRDIGAAQNALVEMLGAQAPADGQTGTETPGENPAAAQIEEQAEGQTELIDGVENPEAPAAEAVESDEAAEEGAPEENSAHGETPAGGNGVLREIRDILAAQSAVRPPEAPPAETPPEEEPEEDFDPENFIEKFTEDPKGTLKALEDSAVAKAKKEILAQIQPALALAENAKQRNDVERTFEQYFAENPDAQNYLDGISAHLRANQLPLNDLASLKDAYQAVKINELSGRKSLDEYLADDESVETMLGKDDFVNKILGHPKFLGKARTNDSLKGQYIQDYLKEIESGGKPAVLSDASGDIPATPPNDAPRTVADATKFLERQLNRK